MFHVQRLSSAILCTMSSQEDAVGRMSRTKGGRVERELVNKLKDAGIAAERVPLSGAAGGTFSGDVLIQGALIAEVKARKDGEGFKTLEGWLGENDMLLLKRNNAEHLAVMPWDVLVTFLTNMDHCDAPEDQPLQDG